MKYTILLLALVSCIPFIVSIPSSPYAPIQAAGKIVSYDTNRCSCCGGWVFMIDDVRYLGGYIEGWEPVRSGGSYPKRFIVYGDTLYFPLPVSLKYSPAKSTCTRINVEAVEILPHYPSQP